MKRLVWRLSLFPILVAPVVRAAEPAETASVGVAVMGSAGTSDVVREAAGQSLTIQADREQVGETRRSLAPEEARSLPGTNGDALKVLQDLPGMGRSPFATGELLVRGAAPGDSKVFLDGQEIPQLYHFGGLTSVVNTEVLDSIDFLPGGFGVRYGGATAGVVDLTTRGAPEEKSSGVTDVNIYDAQAVGKTPLAKDGSAGRVVAALRRSYIDAVIA